MVATLCIVQAANCQGRPGSTVDTEGPGQRRAADDRADAPETLCGAPAAICSLPHLETLVTYWWRLTSLNMSEPQWLGAEELDMWTVGTTCAAVSAVILLWWLTRGHSGKVSLTLR